MSQLKGLSSKLFVLTIKNIFDKKGYVFFDEDKPYNVNIIGVRAENRVANKFDDCLLIVYRNNKGDFLVDSFEATTDPGWTYLKNASKVYGGRGTAILVPGQYIGAYKLDIHGGKNGYLALCQRGASVSIYRDSNKDLLLDFDEKTLTSGYFGINIHRAKRTDETYSVAGYSAGCQVIRKYSDWKRFMSIIDKSSNIYGNSFTYTLIKEEDF